MQIPGLKNRKFISGMVLMFLLAQLFSVHFHFEHVEQDHDVHVHSSLLGDHSHGDEALPDEHGEQENGDLLAWLSKKLSSTDLQAVISFILILPLFILLQQRLASVCLPQWRYQQFFTPPLRAPPQ